MLHYIKRLLELILNIKKNLEPKAGILIYHRVCDLEQDPQQLAVTPLNFERQVVFLKNNYKVISLDELKLDLVNKRIKDKSIVITFDDGYYDNAKFALTILEKHGVPATFYISSGYIDSYKEFWWDELEKIFLLSKNLPPELEIEIGNHKYKWRIISNDDRLYVYNELHPILKKLSDTERNDIIRVLYNWSGAERAARDSHRALTSSELLRIHDSKIASIGAHSVTHPMLSSETFAEQYRQIKESKYVIEKIIGNTIDSFSYPFGGDEDYTKETRQFVVDSGFNNGISNCQGVVTRNSDIYSLPRILIRNWNVNQLQDALSCYFNKLRTIIDFMKDRVFPFYIDFKARLFYRKNIYSGIKKHIPRFEKNHADECHRVLLINTFDSVGGAAVVANYIHDSLNKSSGNYSSRMLVAHAVSGEGSDKIDVIAKEFSILQKDLLLYQEKSALLDLFHLSTYRIHEHPFFKESNIVHLHNLHGNYFNPCVLPKITSLKKVIWTLHDMQSITGHCAHSFECDKWMTGCDDCPDLTIYPSINIDKTKYLWKLKKKIYENSEITIACPSSWLKNKVENSILNHFTVHLVYNGIDTSIFNKTDTRAARKKLKLPDDKQIICFSAYGVKDNKWKGGKLLENIIKEYRQDRSMLFLIIGDDDYKVDADNYINTGYIPNKMDLALYYSASDLYLYPSYADNCPLVVLEAMACGLPVVTFDVGGIPELVRHYETGYIAKYRNYEDLKNGMDYFLRNAEIRKKSSEAAQRRVNSMFTMKLMIDKYLELYKQL